MKIFYKKIIRASACISAVILVACVSPGESLQGSSGYHNSYEGFVQNNAQGVEMVRGKAGTVIAQELAKYDKLLINPITVWKEGSEDRFRDISDTDLKVITDLFHQELVSAVKDGYQVVDHAGVGVLQIDVGLTGVVASDPTLDSALIVVPFMPFITKTEELITGNQSYVGATSIEGTFKDSQTGDEIVAFMDTKIGKRVFEVSADDNLNDPYRYSKKAFQWWASRLRYVLDRSRPN